MTVAVENGAVHGKTPSAKSRPDEVEASDDASSGDSCCVKFRKNLLLPLLFVVALVIGVGGGMLIRETDPGMTTDKRRLMYLKYPGELMMNMLKMVILPLIVSSLISGMSSLPSKAAGKLGLLTVAYYMTTTLIAVIIGIILVLAIQPGHRGEKITVGVDKHTLADPVDTMLDLVRNAFPPNLVEAAFSQMKTEYIVEQKEVNVTNATGDIVGTETIDEIVDFELIMTRNMNVLGLVVFSIAFGLMIGGMGPKAKPLIDFFDLFQQAVIKLVRVIIWYSPIGITFLVMSQIVSMDDPAQSFMQLGWYMLTVIVGLFVHGFIILPLLYLVITRYNPAKFLVSMSPALLLALSTASSSASLPMSLKCLSDRANVHPRVGAFMLPVGATINMDGTALYEAVAALFIAQYNNIDLNVGQIITVSDRLRTTVNVWGDSVGAGIIGKITAKDLAKMDEEEKQDTDSVVAVAHGLHIYDTVGYTNGGYMITDSPHELASRL